MSTDLPSLITAQATANGLEPRLIAAVILQESGGNPDGPFRLEQGFFQRYVWPARKSLIGHVPTSIPLAYELMARSASWGLMQIMGQVARELGFANELLCDLQDPTLNLQYGSRHLKKKLLQGGGTEAGLQLWNGGGNKDYAKEVLARIASGAADHLLGAGGH